MLTEPQIQRFSRQILLRELGGRGQQRLLDIGVALVGSSPQLAVAGDYLRAGGTPVDQPSHPPQFALLSDGSTDLPHLFVGAAGLAHQTSPCTACRELGQEAVSAPAVGDPVALGSLAALVMQRWVVGLGVPPSVILWKDGMFHEAEPPRCPLH